MCRMPRPKSACTFIGPLWVFFTGHVPFFERCCVEHDDGYGMQEIEMAAEEGWLDEYLDLADLPSCTTLELALAVEEGWGREYLDLAFKRCIDEANRRLRTESDETLWDEVCHFGVRVAGWLFYKAKVLIRRKETVLTQE